MSEERLSPSGWQSTKSVALRRERLTATSSMCRAILIAIAFGVGAVSANPAEGQEGSSSPEGFIDLGGTALRGGYDGWHWAFAEFRGELYFTADDGKRGGELWRSNGTPGGTKLVKDIRPGKKGSQLFELNELGGVAYFSATDGSDREVWRTDGTAAGTFSLNVNPTDSSYPDHMRVSAGPAYFYAWNKAHGGELWATDGSVAGTYLVKDIFKGPEGSHPNLLVDVDGTLIFVAEDAEHGMEIWRSDGTAAGTVMLRDIAPGPSSGRPRHMARVGSRVYFQANDGKHGVELWATDGTPEGTVLVKNINQTGDE